ncbi:hypothetical protein RB595_000215 [Gaeumannomyces hyphopodioides]
MQNNRHMQHHRLHQELKRTVAEEVIAELEKRQNGWDRFTDGVKSVISDIKAPFAAPKTSETPSPTRGTTATQTPKPKDEDDDDDVKVTKPAPKPTTTAAPAQKTTTTLQRAVSSSSVQQRSSVGLPASVMPTATADIISETSLAVATNTPTLPPASLESPTSTSLSPAQTSAVAASADAQKAEQDANSTAAKAGIAFGVIGGVLIVFMVIWFIIKKRKDQLERQRLDDERFNDKKFNREFASQSASNAPAAPLAAGAIATDRPRTGNSNEEKQLPIFPKNTDNAWERPTTGNSTNPSNPFGNHAETLDHRPVSPLSDIGVATSTTPVSPVLGGAAAGAAVAGVAAAGALTRKASLRKDLPRPPDLTLDTPSNVPMAAHQPGAPSPGGAAIAAAGGPPTSAVHRVQIDFLPTMEDELELKAGELVRLLFEYDDGWALCIRLDRSKQGVVPRTCLSARPVKPRPGPGRPGPQQPMSRSPGSIERKPVPGQAY